MIDPGVTGLPPALLEQLLNSHSSSTLGDAIQLAKIGRSPTIQAGAPLATSASVQTEALPPLTRGDGRQARNPGIQPTTRDSTSATSINDTIDKAADENVSARARFEDVRPQSKPVQQTPGTSSSRRGIASASQISPVLNAPTKLPAPTAESLAAQRGRGADDPLISIIMRILTMKQGQARGATR